LNAKVQANVNHPSFMEQISNFIRLSDWRQIRKVPGKFSSICRHYSDWLISQRSAPLAVKELREALIKLRPNNSTITPLHHQYLKCCILAKMYHMAAVATDADMTDLTSGVTAKDLVLYFYYGGIALIGMKKFKRAQSYFQQGIGVPTTCLHAMLVETLKKFILVSLIVDGRVPSLSKILYPMLLRQAQVICNPYLDFATAFGSYDPDQCHAVAAAHQEIFIQDRTMGLVKQCIQALYRRVILRITTTYLTLSLPDIASKARLPNPKEAEKLIVRMVENGEIQASIDQSHGMVSFRESPENFANMPATINIDRKLKSFIETVKKLRSMDEEISLSVPYIQRTLDLGTRGRSLRDEMMDAIRQ